MSEYGFLRRVCLFPRSSSTITTHFNLLPFLFVCCLPSHLFCCPITITLQRWRAFRSDARTEASLHFIDGDLIEAFLELRPPVQADVAAAVKMRRSKAASVSSPGQDGMVKNPTRVADRRARTGGKRGTQDQVRAPPVRWVLCPGRGGVLCGWDARRRRCAGGRSSTAPAK